MCQVPLTYSTLHDDDDDDDDDDDNYDDDDEALHYQEIENITCNKIQDMNIKGEMAEAPTFVE